MPNGVADSLGSIPTIGTAVGRKEDNLSELLFPTFPGASITRSRVPIYATAIKKSRGGYEQRMSYQSTPRYKYKMHLNFAREANIMAGGYNEVQTLLNFIDTHKGRWDSFYLTDPYTNLPVRVRFDMDEFEFERLVSQIWEVKTLDFISVKAA